MKKILIGLVLLLIVLLAAVYLFIPGRLEIKAITAIKAASPGVFRSLTSDDSWKNFWPGSTPFKLGNKTYALKERSYNVLIIEIRSDDDTITSTMKLLPIRSDSLTIEWGTEQVNSDNPFKRFTQSRKASALEKDLNTIIEKIKEFAEQPKNIYGYDIKQNKVIDSALITTRRQLDHQPALKDIDDMIQALKKYISENNAVEKNSPMLNVLAIDSSHYEVMTAIPVNKELPLTKEFAPKFLLKGGNILEAEITGGPSKIKNGLAELENYKNDFKFESPAIPYQLLITDRLKEPDTAKWVTRLYYPVY